MSASLWTITMRGGNPRTFQLRGNPTVEHDGGQTVHHIVATQAQVRLLRDLMQVEGCEIEFIPARRESSTQRHERAALLGRGMEDAVWPSPGCPGCFWFDPTDSDPCRYRSGDPTTRSLSLEAHEKARTDASACPVIDA
jgi:hypothetical protein